MTRQELLQEGKERYPIGTKFKNLANESEIQTATREPWFFGHSTNLAAVDVGCGGVVYIDGKWAEVVLYPTGYKQELGSNVTLLDSKHKLLTNLEY